MYRSWKLSWFLKEGICFSSVWFILRSWGCVIEHHEWWMLQMRQVGNTIRSKRTMLSKKKELKWKCHESNCFSNTEGMTQVNTPWKYDSDAIFSFYCLPWVLRSQYFGEWLSFGCYYWLTLPPYTIASRGGLQGTGIFRVSGKPVGMNWLFMILTKIYVFQGRKYFKQCCWKYLQI